MTTTATSTDTSGSNGSKKRLRGMDRVRESEAWYDVCLMHDAVYEAERLCDDIYRAVFDAYKPGGDSTAAKVAASDSIRSKAQEALRLFRKAQTCLTALAGTGEPPF